MTPSDNAPTLPDDFLEQVKEVLENLYDFPFLQRHGLAQQVPQSNRPSEPAGHRLRREVVSAIESLNPGAHVAVRSSAGRVYHLLTLHYVNGMTLQETANDLGISLRQAYRDLRRGQESVAELLWFALRQQAAPVVDDPASESPISTPSAAPENDFESELLRLSQEVAPVNLHDVVETALQAVQQLAQTYNITLHKAAPTGHTTVSANITVLQQIVTHVLSQAIQHCGATTTPDNPTTITVQVADDALLLQLSPSAADSALPISAFIQRLIDHKRWQLHSTSGQIKLHLREKQKTVLIVDDNEGLYALFARYLTGYAYQLAYAPSGSDGLALAAQIKPDAIIMDIMMPGMDGWELLQRLRAQADTAAIPVIICSVIPDPELAYSLGASLFIAKPIDQHKIVHALQQVGL